MEKRWRLKNIPDESIVASLSESINLNESLATLLVQRGITDFEEAKAFFRPSLDQLLDPFLMKDMKEAVERLCLAITTQEKILIYGDYDVDGTTSVSLVYDFLSKRYAHLDFYIPDRYSEGYGTSIKGIEWAAENGFSLIISLDCGIKSVEHVQIAKSLGIDFIICDHHKPGDVLPNAAAVLDPKRKDCPYPFKELSGCGVGFKLLQAFAITNGIDFKELLPFLDLVAISIASDIVPIVDENRILTYYGLEVINSNPRPGVKALIEIAGFKKTLEVSDVVFGLGPRINAAGRITHAKSAVQLLISKEKEEADFYAQQINDKNSIRKDVDSSITEEALKMITDNSALLDSKSTVLFKEDWHKGVIGIVASRCIEKFHKPTIILTESNNKATGSARSVPGFDVYEAISKCSDLLDQFGGHMYAAGLTLKLEKVEAFKKKFEEVVAKHITAEQLIPQIEIDLPLSLSQVNTKFHNIVKQMAPFGPGNLQPVFVSDSAFDDGRARILKEQHLKLFLKQEGNDALVEAIGFGMAHFYPKVINKQKFNICYTICENNFNGIKSIQLLIKDIKSIN